MKCSHNEKNLLKHLQFTPIWTNVIYFIAPILLFYYKEWEMGTIIMIIAIISILHHSFSYMQTQCVPEKTKRHRALSWLDILCSNAGSFYAIYLIWKRGILVNRAIIGLIVCIFIISMVLFFLSLSYDLRAEHLDKSSKRFIKLASLYELYHGFWHIFSGIGILIVSYLLIKDKL